MGEAAGEGVLRGPLLDLAGGGKGVLLYRGMGGFAPGPLFHPLP